MGASIPKTHVDEAAQLHQIANAIRQNMPNQKGIMLLGDSYTSDALANLFDGYGTTVGSYEQALLALKQQRADLDAQQPLIRKSIAGMYGIAVGSFGTTSPILSQFGFSLPKVRAPRTGQEMAAAAAKRNSTRKGLGTLGKQQKAAAVEALHNAAIVAAAAGASGTSSTTPASTAPVTAAPTVAPTATVGKATASTAVDPTAAAK